MKMPGLTTQIFVGLIAGVLIGWQLPQVGIALAPGGEIFLRLIKTIIAPLVFATLVVGIAGAGNMHSVGRLGFKSIALFELLTTFALFVGLLAVNIFQPGAGVHLTAAAGAAGELVAKQPNVADLLTHIFPTSIIDCMARGDVLQIVVFTTLFAAAVSAAKAKPITDLCETLSEVMFKYTEYVMKLAPLGVAAAMASTVGHHGLAVIDIARQAGGNALSSTGRVRCRHSRAGGALCACANTQVRFGGTRAISPGIFHRQQ